MEFWGVEVKPGETVTCEPGDDRLLHLSQAALGETKDKGTESVPIFVKFNDQKLVLGTLSAEKCSQISYDLVFEKKFELSHGSKNASVYFCGYKSLQLEEEISDDDMFDFDSEEEEDVQIAPNLNGKPKVKAEGEKPSVVKSNVDKKDNAVGKPKAKTGGPIKAEPKVEDEDDKSDDDDDDDDDGDEDDSEGSDDDEDMLEAMGDSDDEDSGGEEESDDDDDDDDDDESSEEEDEATPKKAVANGKKRPAESASKTPVPEKKAKLVTPAGQKTGGDGKKNAHVATPHPAKHAGKTPANSDKAKQQTPKSSGSVTCKSCNKSFNSDNALQSHTKAKHSAAK